MDAALCRQVPYAALNYMGSEANYGGRVTDNQETCTADQGIRSVMLTAVAVIVSTLPSFQDRRLIITILQADVLNTPQSP